MDDRSVLLAHAAALKTDLDAARRKIDTAELDDYFMARVDLRFGDLYDTASRDLDDLNERLHVGLDLSTGWRELSKLQHETAPVIEETLALLQGALVRMAGLDDGICRIADGLLDELAASSGVQWSELTILGEREQYAETAQLIRLRFPDFSLWSLPVVAHEFGHLVHHQLRTQRKTAGEINPVEAIIERDETFDPRNAGYVSELFADLFAIYSFGPALAYNVILLRFDPRRAHENRASDPHPSNASRVHFMLATLRQLDTSSGAARSPYHGILQLLEARWRESLAAAGAETGLGRAAEARMTGWLNEFMSILEEGVSAVRYSGWSRAVRIAKNVLSHPNVEGLKEEDDLRDIINAAWISRRQQWDQDGSAKRIEDRARRACELVIEGRHDMDLEEAGV